MLIWKWFLFCFFVFFFTYFTLLNCNCSEDAFSHDACFISNCRRDEWLLDLNFTLEFCHLELNRTEPSVVSLRPDFTLSSDLQAGTQKCLSMLEHGNSFDSFKQVASVATSEMFCYIWLHNVYFQYKKKSFQNKKKVHLFIHHFILSRCKKMSWLE